MAKVPNGVETFPKKFQPDV